MNRTRNERDLHLYIQESERLTRIEEGNSMNCTSSFSHIAVLIAVLTLAACGGSGGAVGSFFGSCTIVETSPDIVQCTDFTGEFNAPDAAETCGNADPMASSSTERCSVVHAADTLVGTCYFNEGTGFEQIFYWYVPTDPANAEFVCNSFPGSNRWELP